MEVKLAGTSSLRRIALRIVRVLGAVVVVFLLIGLNLWAALALSFADLSGAPPRYILSGIYLAVTAAMTLLMRPPQFGLMANVVLISMVLVWYLAIKPSNERDWSPEVSVPASATIDGNRITFHNVRNTDYRTDTDFTPRWDDRTYNMNELRGVDFALCHWGSKAIAHGIVSFDFGDGKYVAISIEARKEHAETYSALQSFFRQFELVYVVADERDVFRVRTNFRNEDVYLYRTRLNPDDSRAVLLSYVDSMNSLRDHPEFYNALTTNCVTSVVPHARAGRLRAQIGWQLLLSGYAARQAYDNGNIDTSMPFEQLESRSRIVDAAMAADHDPDFSTRIRTGLPSPAKVGARAESTTTTAVMRP